MGASQSSLPKAPVLDPTAAQYSASYVQQLERQAQDVTRQLQTQVVSATKWSSIFSWIAGLLLGVGVILGILYGVDYISVKSSGRSILGLISEPARTTDPNKVLYISDVSYDGISSADKEAIATKLRSMIQDNTSLPSFTVDCARLGNPSSCPTTPFKLNVQWYQGYGNYMNTVVSSGSVFPALPDSGSSTTDGGAQPTSGPLKSSSPPSQASPTVFGKLFGGGSSGNLLGSIHDSTTVSVVKGSDAPLSAEGDGAYGMQWWMYIKDWNYGYGKDKSIVIRPDPTNPKVMNPHVSLHPTDNSLKVSVSVFPATEGGAATSQPAPAGHSGSTDDVFICEVPNIPLQTWFSVSITVFGRNLDIYIDGKLVKSCFLSGVPKPATGDIQLTPRGGFSGNMCNFVHYPKMLTPADANSFWTAGTSCQSATEPTVATKATGYSVKFGVYDSLGKQVQQYTF
jgi:hypothetical protein